MYTFNPVELPKSNYIPLKLKIEALLLSRYF